VEVGFIAELFLEVGNKFIATCKEVCFWTFRTPGLRNGDLDK
jgi:hypothetical protein